MERFQNIDWNPSIEDILDNAFVNEERVERESVMFKIMAGNFIDPFKNIDDDYNVVNIDLLGNDINLSDEEKEENDNESKQMKNMETKEPDLKKSKSYVPGIVKSIFKPRRQSKLTKEQQATCLRVLVRFSESDKPKITQSEREELQTYMELQKTISQEQDEFFEFAKSKWYCRQLKLTCEDYINLCWQSKVQWIRSLPKHYTEVANIPFMADKNVTVKFVSTCLQLGHLSRILLPTFTKPYFLYTNSDELRNWFPPKSNVSDTSSVCFKLPVSEDRNCQKLAENYDVDLVISSSGLNCLVNNVGSNYSNSWILPVVIKAQNGRNVIYIDKAAPLTAGTIPEKNAWVYKYILRRFFIHDKHPTSRRKETYNEDDIFGDVNSEDLLKIEEQCESMVENVNSKLHANTLKDEESIKEIGEEQIPENDSSYSNESRTDSCEGSSKICHNTSSSTENVEDNALHLRNDTTLNTHVECKKGITHIDESTQNNEKDKLIDKEKDNVEIQNTNVSYQLYTIGPQSSEQNELMKNSVIKEYKMLVRTKVDGFEKLQGGVQRLLMLAPKLEHQADLGAEAVTLEEAVKQWISLTFRPHTFLARVRISAETSEVLQIERRTAMSINNEIKRLYNIKIEDSLTIFHNVIESLATLSPGRYIMRHTVRNGAFTAVYKEASSPGKNIFDLHTIYGEQFYDLPTPPWLPLDRIVPSPMQKCFERMPAMFHPPQYITTTKKGKSAVARKSNTGTVRRSLRNKKT